MSFMSFRGRLSRFVIHCRAVILPYQKKAVERAGEKNQIEAHEARSLLEPVLCSAAYFSKYKQDSMSTSEEDPKVPTAR